MVLLAYPSRATVPVGPSRTSDFILKKFQFLPKIQWLPDMPLLFPGESYLQ
jgi:hypothetical protein